jgi:hypothetical protein
MLAELDERAVAAALAGQPQKGSFLDVLNVDAPAGAVGVQRGRGNHARKIEKARTDDLSPPRSVPTRVPTK